MSRAGAFQPLQRLLRIAIAEGDANQRRDHGARVQSAERTQSATCQHGGEARGAVVIAQASGRGESVNKVRVGKGFGIKLVEFGRAAHERSAGSNAPGQSSGAIKPNRRRRRSNG